MELLPGEVLVGDQIRGYELSSLVVLPITRGGRDAGHWAPGLTQETAVNGTLGSPLN